jgi:CBS domain-containing protein
MTAEQLITNTIIPLRTSDTGEDALSLMNEFYIRHLPIVNNEQLLGLISEDDILDHDVEGAVGSYALSMIRPYAKYNDHIFELLRLIAEYHLTVIPVVDAEKNYIGMVTMEAIVQYFSETSAFSEPGSILVIEVSKRDYMLSEIARIVESEGATVLNSFITSKMDSMQMDVTIKINRQHVQSIIATFERYDYIIKATFNETEYVDALKERYDALMSYLNV